MIIFTNKYFIAIIVVQVVIFCIYNYVVRNSSTKSTVAVGDTKKEVALGTSTCRNITSASRDNTIFIDQRPALGHNSLFKLTTGDSNTAIGTNPDILLKSGVYSGDRLLNPTK